jgi:hypothetical protein
LEDYQKYTTGRVEIPSERKTDKDGFWTSFSPKGNKLIPQIA